MDFKFNSANLIVRVFVLLLIASCSLGITDCAVSQELDTASFLQTLRKAQAKSQAKEWNEAATLWGQVVKINPVDPAYWRQYATALYEVKNYREAITANKKALEMGSPLSDFPWTISYDIACNYALLGDKQHALEWLDKSWKLGWRDLDSPQKDDDLKSLANDPHFRELVGMVDTSRMTRVEGWRFDLHLLAREIERRHYDPFRKVSRAQFEAQVRALDTQIAGLQDNQIAVGLMKILALVNDGHSVISANSGPASFRKSVPLQFYEFKEGLFIITADAAHRDLVGAQVVRIGDHSVAEVMSAIDPLVGRENPMRLKVAGPAYMRRPPILNGLGLIPLGNELPLTVRSTSGERSVVLPADMDAPRLTPEVTKDWVSLAESTGKSLPISLEHPSAPYWFEYLPDTNILYFQFNQVRNDPAEPFTQFVDRLFADAKAHEVNKMIIDLRGNGGGNTFLVQPLIDAIIENRQINQRGKLFVIIGRATYSAAMNTSDFLERETNALFVGEPSGSSPNFIGETAAVTLSYSKLSASISDLYWESSWPMDHRTWIAPLLYTPPTYAAYIHNRDTALEAILAYKE